ncbi:MAG: DUF1573 domain-containing protein [Planctomycetota bacterium]|nr:MAG: DUF1573 domain-containing protein [Planctomycetota bacterium]
MTPMGTAINTVWSVCVLGMLLATVSHGQTVTAPSGPLLSPVVATPAITVTPPLIDFGAIKPGSRQKGVFQIHNHGAAMMKIESAFPSCKCTTISDMAGKEIPPGAEVELIASLDAPRTPGEKDAKVFVKIVGVEQPLIAKMQGVVELPLSVYPAFIDALKGKSKGVVEISNPTKAPFHILSCDGAAPEFVDFDPAKDAARSTYRVRWDFAMVPKGKLQQWWCVETDVADCRIVPFRIRHESTGILFDSKSDERRWFIPEAIAIAGQIALNKPVELEVEIECTLPRGKPQPPGWDMVRGIESRDPAVKVELISSKREGDRVRIQFRFTVEKSNSHFVYAPLFIQTDTGSGRFFVAAVVAQ